MRRLVLCALVLLAAPVRAQVVPAVPPVYHGLLDVRRGGGPFDVDTGEAVLRVARWRFILVPDSNGIFPDREQLIIALDDNEYVLDAGSLDVSRSGRTFSYRAPKGTPPPAVKRLRIKSRRDGSYAARFTLTGLRLARLVISDPLCVPMAIIVGDDDFFSGVELVRPGSFLSSRRFAIASTCDVGNDWPWL